MDNDGFVKYLCKFSCQDDINKYSKIDTDTYICDKDGKVKITSLLMEIFELGSIKDFSWNADNFYILKDLLKKTLEILFKVSKETGFIHRDLHCGNIMIKKNAYGNYYPVIIDLEKSLFVNNNEINKYKYTSLDKDKPLEKIIAINDLKDLFSKLMFLNNSKINIDVTDILKHVRYISDNETTFDSLQDFYRLIDKMEIYG